MVPFDRLPFGRLRGRDRDGLPFDRLRDKGGISLRLSKGASEVVEGRSIDKEE